MHNNTNQLQELYAHSANDQGVRQLLVDHLRQVAELARRFAEPFNAGDLAFITGLWHDVGKADPLWQQRLIECKQEERKRIGLDHKCAGALLAEETAQSWIIGFLNAQPTFRIQQLLSFSCACLYSALVDADSLDTEAHKLGAISATRRSAVPLTDLWDRYKRFVEGEDRTLEVLPIGCVAMYTKLVSRHLTNQRESFVLRCQLVGVKPSVRVMHLLPCF